MGDAEGPWMDGLFCERISNLFGGPSLATEFAFHLLLELKGQQEPATKGVLLHC